MVSGVPAGTCERRACARHNLAQTGRALVTVAMSAWTGVTLSLLLVPAEWTAAGRSAVTAPGVLTAMLLAAWVTGGLHKTGGSDEH